MKKQLIAEQTQLTEHHSFFQHIHEDLVKIIKYRKMLEEPYDLSINLSSEGKDDLTLIREYEQQLKEGQNDPILFLYKRQVEESYDDFSTFLNKENLPLKNYLNNS